jgi:hypothetical protein
LLSNSVFVISDYSPYFEDYDKNINSFFLQNVDGKEESDGDERDNNKPNSLSRSLQLDIPLSSPPQISLANSFPSLSNPNIWNDRHNTEVKKQYLFSENSFTLYNFLNFDFTYPLKICTDVELSSLFIFYF